MEKLKFLKDAKSVVLTEDFYYMINGGGWASPEYFLEKEDAEKVSNAIKLIDQYERQGINEGYFEEI